MQSFNNIFRFSDDRQHKRLTGFVLLLCLLGTDCDRVVRQSEINTTGPEVVASGSVVQCEKGIPGCSSMMTDNIDRQDQEPIFQSYMSESDITVDEQAQQSSDDNMTVNQQSVVSEQGVLKNSQGQPSKPTLIELSQQALYQADVQKKIDAINAIALYRNDQAIETLLQATSDSEPAVRYLALQTLRYALADRLDKDGRILAVLEQARLDYDSQVAQLAERIAEELSTPVNIASP